LNRLQTVPAVRIGCERAPRNDDGIAVVANNQDRSVMLLDLTDIPPVSLTGSGSDGGRTVVQYAT
jgi:hypothetical protein